MSRQRTSERLLSFEMDGEVVVVPLTQCPQCAGTGTVEDYPDHMPPLVDAVEFRRDQYGWNSSRMAKELGLGRGHYSEFVSGKRGLPLTARIRAHSLGIPAEILLQPPSPTNKKEQL